MRSFLKTIPAVYSANSFIKDIVLSLETAWIKHTYQSRLSKLPDSLVSGDIRSMMHNRMKKDGVRPILRATSPLHIYFVGTYYDHEALGFLQALEYLGVVSIYYDINGEYGINSSNHRDGSAATAADNRFLVDQIRALHSEHPIDFVIGTFVASSVSVDTLILIRKMGIPVINYAMDDRLPVHWRIKQGVRMGAIGLVQGVDLALQTTKEFVPRYLAEGCPCVYWPFASDPHIYSPGKQKDLDVVFVGNNYGKRNALVKAIQSAGIGIECYGRDFPNGHLPGDRVPNIFSRAKIILGTGLVGHSSKIVTLKLRDFDAPMSGALYITNHSPDLAEFYEIGREIVTYSSTQECVEKMKYFLSNDEERKSVAAAGRLRAIKDHDWKQRFSVLLRLLEGCS